MQTNYARNGAGIVVKGDIPLVIYHCYGAWCMATTQLYHYEFPGRRAPRWFCNYRPETRFHYNWESKMKPKFVCLVENSVWTNELFIWCIRIDHIILDSSAYGVFRSSSRRIYGHFEPAIAVLYQRIRERNIWFDYNRFCLPYITEELLSSVIRDQLLGYVLEKFHNYDGFNGSVFFKPEFSNTAGLFENYFSWQEDTQHNQWLKKNWLSITQMLFFGSARSTRANNFIFASAWKAPFLPAPSMEAHSIN